MSQDKFRMKSAVYLIPRRDDEVLLSLRKNTGWMDGHYSLIAGHIEEGETATDAMVREAKEEGGVTLNQDDLKFVHVLHRLKDDPNDTYIDFYFDYSGQSDEFVNNEPDKCGGLDWFKVDELPENILVYVKDVLAKSSQGIFYSSVRNPS